MFELCVALFITAIAFAMMVPTCIRTLDAVHLQKTCEQLVWYLRNAQATAQLHETPNTIVFARFNPYYFVAWDSQQSRLVHFDPGVRYVDGYLQMQAARVAYSASGSSAVSGTVRLTTGSGEEDIQLFMGSGLQVLRDKP